MRSRGLQIVHAEAARSKLCIDLLRIVAIALVGSASGQWARALSGPTRTRTREATGCLGVRTSFHRHDQLNQLQTLTQQRGQNASLCFLDATLYTHFERPM